MTEVRVRHVDDPHESSLGDVPFEDIESVIPTLKRWGVYAGEQYEDGMSGQFTVDESGAYFEVVVGDE